MLTHSYSLAFTRRFRLLLGQCTSGLHYILYIPTNNLNLRVGSRYSGICDVSGKTYVHKTQTYVYCCIRSFCDRLSFYAEIPIIFGTVLRFDPFGHVIKIFRRLLFFMDWHSWFSISYGYRMLQAEVVFLLYLPANHFFLVRLHGMEELAEQNSITL